MRAADLGRHESAARNQHCRRLQTAVSLKRGVSATGETASHFFLRFALSLYLQKRFRNGQLLPAAGVLQLAQLARKSGALCPTPHSATSLDTTGTTAAGAGGPGRQTAPVVEEISVRSMRCGEAIGRLLFRRRRLDHAEQSDRACVVHSKNSGGSGVVTG